MRRINMNNELEKEIYLEIKQIFENARNKAYRAVNFVMVEAYWEIGKVIIEKQGGKETSKYGSNLLKKLSIQLTKDYGKGFNETNLRRMRQFYLVFKNRASVRHELSWTHYKLLIKVENEFYYVDSSFLNSEVKTVQNVVTDDMNAITFEVVKASNLDKNANENKGNLNIEINIRFVYSALNCV